MITVVPYKSLSRLKSARHSRPESPCQARRYNTVLAPFTLKTCPLMMRAPTRITSITCFADGRSISCYPLERSGPHHTGRHRTDSAPSAASSCAIAKPISFAAPVTTASRLESARLLICTLDIPVFAKRSCGVGPPLISMIFGRISSMRGNVPTLREFLPC